MLWVNVPRVQRPWWHTPCMCGTMAQLIPHQTPERGVDISSCTGEGIWASIHHHECVVCFGSMCLGYKHHVDTHIACVEQWPNSPSKPRKGGVDIGSCTGEGIWASIHHHECVVCFLSMCLG